MNNHTQEAALDAINAYLGEVDRLLRRKLPAAWIEDAIDEARRHLEDRSGALIAEGMPPDQAKAVSVSAFGPAKEWAQSVAESAYEDSGAKRARVLARIGFVMALGESAFLLLARSSSFWRDELPSAFWSWPVELSAMGLAIILVGIGAFRGRRFQGRFLAVAGALMIAFNFACFGRMSVVTSDGNSFLRQDLARDVRLSRLCLERSRDELKLLRLGVNVYNHPFRPVPPSLLDHGRYISLGPVRFDESELWPTPFKRFTPEQIAECRRIRRSITPEKRIAVENVAPYRIAVTREDASLAWRTYGDEWIGQEELNLKNHVRQFVSSREASMRPAGFDSLAGARPTIGFGILAALLILLDRISASAGRWAFRWRKAPRLTTR